MLCVEGHAHASKHEGIKVRCAPSFPPTARTPKLLPHQFFLYPGTTIFPSASEWICRCFRLPVVPKLLFPHLQGKTCHESVGHLFPATAQKAISVNCLVLLYPCMAVLPRVEEVAEARPRATRCGSHHLLPLPAAKERTGMQTERSGSGLKVSNKRNIIIATIPPMSQTPQSSPASSFIFNPIPPSPDLVLIALHAHIRVNTFAEHQLKVSMTSISLLEGCRVECPEIVTWVAAGGTWGMSMTM